MKESGALRCNCWPNDTYAIQHQYPYSPPAISKWLTEDAGFGLGCHSASHGSALLTASLALVIFLLTGPSREALTCGESWICRLCVCPESRPPNANLGPLSAIGAARCLCFWGPGEVVGRKAVLRSDEGGAGCTNVSAIEYASRFLTCHWCFSSWFLVLVDTSLVLCSNSRKGQ